MKTLKCSDLDPDSDCQFEATGETNEEVIGKIHKHAEEHHAEKLKGMTPEQHEGMKKKMNEILDSQ